MKSRIWMKSLVQLILASTVSLSHAGAYEDFFKAVELDDGRTVTQLLRRGFDVNSPSDSGQTALFLALRAGAHQVVAALLAAPDLKIDHANQANETALMMAALKGHLDWCRRLVERGAAVNRDGWTPLHYAAAGPNPKAVAFLLEQGAQVDALSPNGTTALMMAARYGDEGSVPVLLAARANPKLRNQKDLGPADFAKDGGRESLALRLEALARP
jgi:ankyrin repeat protein